eukprot:TRINITY_DN16714_c0_g1_i1.p1 TRINITY_DN16714_c0_g1~~TRINITY_DN16714_c0_g1_i1.p1  ORF type:complete len:594 (-),score=64.81 TRINITY_DN16714_c0_g1_i1:3-1784(-)
MCTRHDLSVFSFLNEMSHCSCIIPVTGFLRRASESLFVFAEIPNGVRVSCYQAALVGASKALAELIYIDGRKAWFYVHERVAGLRVGDPIHLLCDPYEIELGPGLFDDILDALQRPLGALRQSCGDWRVLPALGRLPLHPTDKTWHFQPLVTVGQPITVGDRVGQVLDNSGTNVLIFVIAPNGSSGKVVDIQPEGRYTATEPICSVASEEGTVAIAICERRPLRTPRYPPSGSCVPKSTIAATGLRVLDSCAPVFYGDTVVAAGAFGTGKTSVLQTLTLNALGTYDCVVAVLSGVRGNEVKHLWEKWQKNPFPRRVLIACTADAPVSGRETSVMMGMVVAEYLRDMGFRVLLTMDCITRWIRLWRPWLMFRERQCTRVAVAQLVERAGNWNHFGRNSSITLVCAASPYGGDFAEQSVSDTLLAAHVFWAFDRKLVQRRCFPAVNHTISFSKTVTRVEFELAHIRSKMAQLLQQQTDLDEIIQLVGYSALDERSKAQWWFGNHITSHQFQQAQDDELCPVEETYGKLGAVLELCDFCCEVLEHRQPLFPSWSHLRQVLDAQGGGVLAALADPRVPWEKTVQWVTDATAALTEEN